MQKERESAKSPEHIPDDSGVPGGVSPSDKNKPGSKDEVGVPYSVISKHFFMSAEVDPVRVNKVVSMYVEEIIRHLMTVNDAKVELRLDVDVFSPQGIPDTTVRIVSENCKALKISDFGFDS